MSPGPDDREYSSRDLQDAAGLTPRQQNDWDSRGALPHERDGEEGWRRYTPREIFALMVSTEIRRQYGTPVEQLKWVQQTMLEKDANHFEAAVELMSFLGIGVWLCTDLQETFVVDSELEFTDMWRLGIFSASRERALVFLPLNPLVNRLLSCLKDPVELPTHGRGYQIRDLIEAAQRARSPEEQLVLDLIRNEEVDTVSVRSPGGKVEVVRAIRRHSPADDIRQLLDEPYQSLTVKKRDGRTVYIEQEITIKPGNEAQW